LVDLRAVEEEGPMKLARMPVGLPTMNRDIEEVFDRFFNAPLTFPGYPLEPARKAIEGTWMPVLDFTETDKEYLIRVEVPGVPRDNLDVQLEGDILTLTGHREKVIKEEKENVLWAEREAGRFVRTIRLPKPVEANKIDASFAEGVLTVRLPKVETAIKNKILIKG
jgi:HSP20 family protein